MNTPVIVWGILKALLLVLCVALAVVATLCVLVLFVPIRYNMEDSLAKRLSGSWRFSWLLNSLRVFYSYGTGKGKLEVKVLCFTVRIRKKIVKQGGADREPDRIKQPPTSDDASAREGDEIRGNRNEQESHGIFTGLIRFMENAAFVARYPQRKEIIELTIAYVKRMWKAVRPDDFYMSGELGFSDPSSTGIALGLVSVVRAMLRLDVRLSGNFERAVVDINTKTSGKVALFSMVLPTVRYVFAKPIWTIVKPILFGKGERL